MQKRDYKFVFLSFLVWRVGILIIAYLSINFIPLFSHNYLGGGYANYISNSLFWGQMNFDGEHYLAIAQNGYKPLEYFFFPLYSYLIKMLSFNGNQITLVQIGLFVSNLSFLVSLIGIYKVVSLDYKNNIARATVVLFLIFPTSFYFAIYYTESIFLALVIWGFYMARKGNFLVASVLAALASATRVVGVFMVPVLIIEFLLQKRRNFLPLIISPLGVIYYMYFLFKQTGDPLIFVHQVSMFGEQRSSTLILLPQVIYRYVFKILPNVSYMYFPNIFTSYLEFGIAILFLLLIIYGLFKLRISYLIFSIFAYIVPTLAGSFSSMPRYVLVIFPAFILSSVFINKLPKFYKYTIISVMLILIVIAESLFWRGYWIS